MCVFVFFNHSIHCSECAKQAEKQRLEGQGGTHSFLTGSQQVLCIRSLKAHEPVGNPGYWNGFAFVPHRRYEYSYTACIFVSTP